MKKYYWSKIQNVYVLSGGHGTFEKFTSLEKLEDYCKQHGITAEQA